MNGLHRKTNQGNTQVWKAELKRFSSATRRADQSFTGRLRRSLGVEELIRGPFWRVHFRTCSSFIFHWPITPYAWLNSFPNILDSTGPQMIQSLLPNALLLLELFHLKTLTSSLDTCFSHFSVSMYLKVSLLNTPFPQSPSWYPDSSVPPAMILTESSLWNQK